MKNFLCLLLLAVSCSSYGDGIAFFQGSWEKALAKAKSENKLLFVDVYTDWCAPCKKMEKDVFPLREVGDFFNKNFINVKINAEEGEGVGFAEHYHVKNFPTYLFVDGSGAVENRYMGAMAANLFVELAKEVNGGGFHAMLAQYADGERDPEFIHSLVQRAKAMQESLDQDVAQKARELFERLGRDYFASKDPDDFLSEHGFAMVELCLAGKGRGNKVTEYVFSYPDKFSAYASPLRVSRFIVDNNEAALMDGALVADASYRSYWQQREGILHEHYSRIAAENPDFSPLEGMQLESYVAIGNKDWAGYLESTRTAMNQEYGPAEKNDEREDFIIATLLFLSKHEPSALAFLEPLAKKRFDRLTGFYSADNYGDILLQLGKKKGAREVFQRALDSGKLVDELQRKSLQSKLDKLED